MKMVGIALLVIGIVGLLALVSTWKKRSNKGNGVGIACSIVVLLAGWWIIPSDAMNSQSTTTTTTQQPTSSGTQTPGNSTTSPTGGTQAKTSGISVTPDQFKDAFNKQAASFGINDHIDAINIRSGAANDAFEVRFANHFGLVGTVAKQTGLVFNVTMLGQTDGSPQSVSELEAYLGALIASANPSLAPNDRQQVLKDLGLGDQHPDIKTLNKSTSKNGIKYAVKSSGGIGIVFGMQTENQ